MSLRIGIDIGSTTVKVVVLDEHNKLLFRSYERHYSKTRERACQTLRSISEMLAGQQIRVTITGSAGLGVANAAGIDFLPSDQAIRCLVRQGKTEQRYGARPLRRLIRTQVEDPAADLLLRQAVTAGSTLYLEEDEGQLVLSPLT